MKKIILIMTLLLLIGAGAGSYYFFKQRAEAKMPIKRQAVFLTNGQVYFGEISDVNENFITLDKIFYLKTQDQLNEAEDKKIALIKLGEELHGPEDQMKISLKNVLYYEQMKNDSKINQAIEGFYNKPKS